MECMAGGYLCLFWERRICFEPAFLPKKEKEGNQTFKITMLCVSVSGVNTTL